MGDIGAPVHLPDGAVVIGAEMDYCRANGSTGANRLTKEERDL